MPDYADEPFTLPVTGMLPELPEPTDDEDAEVTALFLSVQGQGSTPLTDYDIALADAQEYCSRDDTHGDGWFVGFWRATTPEERAASAERDTTLLAAARKIDRLLSENR